jgi:hypothetical protein
MTTVITKEEIQEDIQAIRSNKYSLTILQKFERYISKVSASIYNYTSNIMYVLGKSCMSGVNSMNGSIILVKNEVSKESNSFKSQEAELLFTVETAYYEDVNAWVVFKPSIEDTIFKLDIEPILKKIFKKIKKGKMPVLLSYAEGFILENYSNEDQGNLILSKLEKSIKEEILNILNVKQKYKTI